MNDLQHMQGRFIKHRMIVGIGMGVVGWWWCVWGGGGGVCDGDYAGEF